MSTFYHNLPKPAPSLFMVGRLLGPPSILPLLPHLAIVPSYFTTHPALSGNPAGCILKLYSEKHLGSLSLKKRYSAQQEAIAFSVWEGERGFGDLGLQ